MLHVESLCCLCACVVSCMHGRFDPVLLGISSGCFGVVVILSATQSAEQFFLREVATPPSGPSTAAPALTPDQLSSVLTLVKDCLLVEMQSLKRELSQEREAADDRLVKRMRMEKGPSFKEIS